MFPLPNGETVSRLRGTPVRDPYSGELSGRDWSNPDELTLQGVAIAPGSSTESSTLGRQMTITNMSIYGPTGMNVLPEDRIRSASGLWEVVGEVADWKNAFTGWSPGCEFSLKKVSG